VIGKDEAGMMNEEVKTNRAAEKNFCLPPSAFHL
jgi:hypothetical protein